MFSILAFTASQAAGATNADMPGVTDGWAALSNNHYLLPQDMRLQHAFAMGATITRARINTPSLRAVSLPSLSPLEQAAAVSDIPAIVPYGDYGPMLKSIEEVAMETSNTAGAPERHVGGLWVSSPQGPAPLPGPTFTVRATAAITTGNLSWGNGVMTFEQTLPAGRYQVVGMDVIGANVVFGRLRFAEGGMLPGVLGRGAINLLPWWFWRFGRAGVFGYFNNTAPPLLEIFAIGAGVTQEIYLDLIKVP